MNLLEKLAYVGVVLPTSLSSLVARSSGESFDAAGVDGLNVRFYRTWPGNERLIGSWTELGATAAGAGACFSRPPGTGRSRGRSRGSALPRVQRAPRRRAVPRSFPFRSERPAWLETPGEMISDYLEPLVETDGEESAWRSLLGMLGQECKSSGCGSIVLHNVPADGHAARSSRESARITGWRWKTSSGAVRSHRAAGDVGRISCDARGQGAQGSSGS